MLVQFQFVSFYKIKNTLFLSRDFTIIKDAAKGKQNKALHNNSQKSILTTNIHIFYIIMFLLKFYKPENMSKTVESNKQLECIDAFKLSFFFLPVMKQSVIFLRAPYKNKLARLNILQLSYKFFFSIKSNSKTISLKIDNRVENLITLFTTINLSSFKIKHTKTKVSFCTQYESNFWLNNFN